MQLKTFSVLIGSAIFISACASNKQEALDYHTPGVKKGQQTLEVPPDLTGISQPDRYTIPVGSGAVRASQLAGQSPTVSGSSAVLPKVENMHIERDGSLRWLRIDDKSPQEIWPLLRAFWQEGGFVIDKENPQTGFMETQWAENRANIPTDIVRRLFDNIGLGGVYSSGLRDKFIARIERIGENGTAVTFSHRGMKEVMTGKDDDISRWEPRPTNSNLEAQLLARFMLRLGADEAAVKQQMANTGSAGQLAALQQNTLLLNGEHERNVHRLRLALDRIGLTVENFDNTRNIFLVQPADVESESVSTQKPGMFSRLFGAEEKKPEPKPKLWVQIAPNADNSDSVTLYHTDGKPYRGSEADYILQQLLAQLH